MKNKTNKLRNTFLAASFCLLNTISYGQTKEETISWLQEKLKNNLESYSSYNRDSDRTILSKNGIQSVQVKECEILVQYYYTWAFSGGTTEYYDIIIPTQNLYISDDGYFYLDYKGIKQVHTKSTTSISDDINVPSLLIHTNDVLIIDFDGEINLKERIKKALIHLASFCPEKKKETF